MPNARSASPGAVLIGIGGVLLAASPFLPWVKIFILGDVDLFQLLQAAGAPEGWAWLATGGGVSLAVVGFSNIEGKHDLRTVAVVAAVLVGFSGGLGILRLLNLVSHSEGFVSIGVGVAVAAIAEVLLIAAVVVQPARSVANRPPGPTVPAGWYLDPTGRPAMRWWNGRQWTEQLGPISPPSSPPARVYPPPAYPGRAPGDQRGSTPPPPGWYSDPSGTPGLRWWDGETWTDHRTSAPSPPPVT